MDPHLYNNGITKAASDHGGLVGASESTANGGDDEWSIWRREATADY